MSRSTLRRTTLIALTVSTVLLAALTPSASAGVASPCKVRNLNSDVLSTDLQGAIAAANAGDRLRIKGTCVGNFVINKDLTLRGAAGGNAGILDGNDAGRTVEVNFGVTATLRRLTVTGGLMSNAPGAGIRNNGTLTVRNSTISGNENQGFGEGGGIEVGVGDVLTVTSSTITGNTAYKGGGIHQGPGATATVNGSTISGNTATESGGGIDFIDSTVTLNDSTITGNMAGTCGGGVFNSGGTLNVLGTSSISGNTPDDVEDQGFCDA